MTLLNELSLAHDQLSGHIGSEISRLALLNQLILAQNQLSGQIGSETSRITMLAQCTRIGQEQD